MDKIEYQDNHLDFNVEIIDDDTIYSKVGDEYLLNVSMQSQPGFESFIFKRIEDKTLVDITAIPGEATLVGYFEDSGVQRYIYEIQLNLNKSHYKLGCELNYIIQVKSESEILEKKLTILIQ